MLKRDILPSFPANALAALAFLASGVPAATRPAAVRIPFEAAPDQGNYIYKVQRGDTMRSIATRYLLHSSDLGALLALNHVPNANRLAVGSTVTIPRKLLMVVPARGVIAAFRGSVSLGPDRPAKVDRDGREQLRQRYAGRRFDDHPAVAKCHPHRSAAPRAHHGGAAAGLPSR